MEHWIEMDSQEKACVGISYEFEKIVKDNFLTGYVRTTAFVFLYFFLIKCHVV